MSKNKIIFLLGCLIANVGFIWLESIPGVIAATGYLIVWALIEHRPILHIEKSYVSYPDCFEEKE